VTAARLSHRTADPHNFHRPIWCSHRRLGYSIEYPRFRFICARGGPGQHTSKPLYGHVKPSFLSSRSSQWSKFRQADIALVFLLLFAKALLLASSIMSLLRLTGWTHQIGKSACGGYRHNPSVRSGGLGNGLDSLPTLLPRGTPLYAPLLHRTVDRLPSRRTAMSKNRQLLASHKQLKHVP
jgi:hypothetical protein